MFISQHYPLNLLMGGLIIMTLTQIDTCKLHYLDAANINSNMDALINFYKKKNGNAELIGNSKEDFFTALNSLQYAKIPNQREKVIIQFQNDKMCKHLIQMGAIPEEATENNKHLYNDQQQEEITNNLNKAFQLLEILHPGLRPLIDRLIGTILCFNVKGFGGGSASGVIGLIWFSPPSRWTIVDYADALYHEFIHNSIFLENMINGVLPKQEVCETEEALTTSAILKKKRPLDRAYHSAGVSIGLMHFYHMMNDHKKANSFLDPLKVTLSELETKKHFLRERGIQNLDGMIKFAESLDYESISKSLKII